MRKHPNAECENCPLAETGRVVPTSFATSHNHSAGRIALIGEAPGRSEVAKGKVFIGLSGQLTERMLAPFGLERSDVTLTNALMCHYPGDKAPKAAIAACRPRLVAELQQANVETALLLGNSAAQSLMPEFKGGITRLRAGPPRKIAFPSVQQNVEAHGLPDKQITVVPTFHPAAVMRNHGQFPLLLRDIEKAITHKVTFPWYEPNVTVTTIPAMALEALNQLSLRTGPICVDTESGREKDEEFGNALLDTTLCIGLESTQSPGQVWVLPDEVLSDPKVKENLKILLKSRGIVAQNGKHDVSVLMTLFWDESDIPLEFDTLLASYVLHEIGGIHGLDYLSQEFLGTPSYKHLVKPYITKEHGYGSIPRDILYKYNAWDVHSTTLLYSLFSNAIEEQGLTQIYNYLLRVSRMMVRVERNGLGVDLEKNYELEQQFRGELDSVETRLPINPRSWQQVKKYLLDFGIKVPNTQEPTLTALSDMPVTPDIVRSTIADILEARGLTKLLSTYVTGLRNKLGSDNKAHPTFLIHGTTTGRLSSRAPNAQNQPRLGDIKRQFTAPTPGKLLVEVDFGQIELRVLTWLAQDENMRGLFNDPSRDVFVELCKQMFESFDQLPPQTQNERRVLVKSFAYGVSYGREARSVAEAFSINVRDAENYMKVFKDMVPDIMQFQKEVIAKIHRGEDLINAYGRHRRFYLLTDMNRGEVEREGMAYLPQSTASDICLDAAIKLVDAGVPVCNLIHDAILAEASPDEVDDIAELMSQVMIETGREITNGYVSFITKAKVGRTWADLAERY